VDDYYYLVNNHKVRLIRWHEPRKMFLVVQENGVQQLIPEGLLKKTDERVPDSQKDLREDLTKL
jgi:hypothetical protein